MISGKDTNIKKESDKVEQQKKDQKKEETSQTQGNDNSTSNKKEGTNAKNPTINSNPSNEVVKNTDNSESEINNNKRDEDDTKKKTSSDKLIKRKSMYEEMHELIAKKRSTEYDDSDDEENETDRIERKKKEKEEQERKKAEEEKQKEEAEELKKRVASTKEILLKKANPLQNLNAENNNSKRIVVITNKAPKNAPPPPLGFNDNNICLVKDEDLKKSDNTNNNNINIVNTTNSNTPLQDVESDGKNEINKFVTKVINAVIERNKPETNGQSGDVSKTITATIATLPTATTTQTNQPQGEPIMKQDNQYGNRSTATDTQSQDKNTDSQQQKTNQPVDESDPNYVPPPPSYDALDFKNALLEEASKQQQIQTRGSNNILNNSLNANQMRGDNSNINSTISVTNSSTSQSQTVTSTTVSPVVVQPQQQQTQTTTLTPGVAATSTVSTGNTAPQNQSQTLTIQTQDQAMITVVSPQTQQIQQQPQLQQSTTVIPTTTANPSPTQPQPQQSQNQPTTSAVVQSQLQQSTAVNLTITTTPNSTQPQQSQNQSTASIVVQTQLQTQPQQPPQIQPTTTTTTTSTNSTQIQQQQSQTQQQQPPVPKINLEEVNKGNQVQADPKPSLSRKDSTASFVSDTSRSSGSDDGKSKSPRDLISDNKQNNPLKKSSEQEMAGKVLNNIDYQIQQNKTSAELEKFFITMITGFNKKLKINSCLVNELYKQKMGLGQKASQRKFIPYDVLVSAALKVIKRPYKKQVGNTIEDGYYFCDIINEKLNEDLKANTNSHDEIINTIKNFINKGKSNINVVKCCINKGICKPCNTKEMLKKDDICIIFESDNHPSFSIIANENEIKSKNTEYPLKIKKRLVKEGLKYLNNIPKELTRVQLSSEGEKVIQQLDLVSTSMVKVCEGITNQIKSIRDVMTRLRDPGNAARKNNWSILPKESPLRFKNSNNAINNIIDNSVVKIIDGYLEKVDGIVMERSNHPINGLFRQSPDKEIVPQNNKNLLTKIDVLRKELEDEKNNVIDEIGLNLNMGGDQCLNIIQKTIEKNNSKFSNSTSTIIDNNSNININNITTISNNNIEKVNRVGEENQKGILERYKNTLMDIQNIFVSIRNCIIEINKAVPTTKEIQGRVDEAKKRPKELKKKEPKKWDGYEELGKRGPETLKAFNEIKDCAQKVVGLSQINNQLQSNVVSLLQTNANSTANISTPPQTTDTQQVIGNEQSQVVEQQQISQLQQSIEEKTIIAIALKNANEQIKINQNNFELVKKVNSENKLTFLPEITKKIIKLDPNKFTQFVGIKLEDILGLAKDNVEVLKFIDPKQVLAAVKQNLKATTNDDRELFLMLIEMIPEALKYYPSLANDAGFVIDAVTKNAQAFKFINPKLQQDKELCKKFVVAKAAAFEFMGEEERRDIDVVKKMLQKDRTNIKYLCHATIDLKNHNVIAIAKRTVGLEGGLLREKITQLAPQLSAHPLEDKFNKIVKLIKESSLLIDNDDEIAQLIAEIKHWLKDKDNVDKIGPILTNAKNDLTKDSLLKDADKILINNSTFATEAIENDPTAFEFAGDDARNDRHVAKRAVELDSNNLKFVNERLKTDINNQDARYVVTAAIKKDSTALWLAGKAFQEAPCFIKMAFERYEFERDTLEIKHQDSHVIDLVVNGLKFGCICEDHIKWVGYNRIKHLFDNERVAEAAVKKNGLSIQYFTKYRSNPHIAGFAVKQNGLALQHVDSAIMTPELLKMAFLNNPAAFNFAKLWFDAMQKKYESTNDNEVKKAYNNSLSSVIAVALKGDIKNIRSKADEYLKPFEKTLGEIAWKHLQDLIKDEYLQIVSNNGLLLEFVGDEFKNRDIILAAVKNNGLAYKFITDDKLKHDVEIVSIATNYGEKEEIVKLVPKDFEWNKVKKPEKPKKSLLDGVSNMFKEVKKVGDKINQVTSGTIATIVDEWGVNGSNNNKENKTDSTIINRVRI